jgi:hypothetical protein
MLFCFFDCKGIVHQMFFPPCLTWTRNFVSKFWMSKKMGSSCEAKIVPWQAGPAPWQWAQTHNAFPEGVICEKSIVVLEHPAYSPDLILWRFCSSLPWRIITMYHILKHGGDSGYIYLSKQLVDEWLLEVLLKLEMMLEFMYSCRRFLLWRRSLQFRLKFSTALPMNTVSLFNCQTLYKFYHTFLCSPGPDIVWWNGCVV